MIIDLALPDDRGVLVKLDDEVPKTAAMALLPFRGIW
jgi:hypothetical protein